MTATGLHIDRETFSCSICLDLLKDPVSIPCGHSYCMSCIKTHWDGEVGEQRYSCPQCRHRFTLRPVLVKNTMLSVLMEGLKKSGAPAAPLSPSSAAHGHVLCDLCSGTKVKAVKSCLQCLVSYCKEHLQPHYDVAALKKHKLVEPIENLQENMCSVHDEVMKMFCRFDQQCICYLCSLDQHKGHHTVTAAAERTEKQRELQAFQQNIQLRISHIEKDLEGLHQHLKNSSGSADAAVEHSDRSLKELRHLLEKRMSLVKQQVRSQQEAEEHRVKEVQDKVQQEISELKRKLTELDTLSHSEDHVHFLHKFASLSKVSENSESVNSSLSPPPFQDMVTAAVSKLRSSLQDTSLLDPPAASNKTQVKAAKTDGLLAAAQGTSTSQQKGQKLQTLREDVPPPSQNSQKKGRTGTRPHQGQPTETVQKNVSAPQSSQEAGLVNSASVVHNSKLSTPNDRPDGILQTELPRDCLLCIRQYKIDLAERGRHNGMTFPDEYPALPDHILNLKAPALTPLPQFRSDLLKFKECLRKLTWDSRSINGNVVMINDGLELVNYDSHKHTFVNHSHPLKFTELLQAVSQQRLTGQCYFEVAVWMPMFFYSATSIVAVAYEDIRRDGSSDECCFGMNANSWAMEIHREDHCWFWHNGNREEILMKSLGPFTMIGVFVDCEAGILSFYKKHRSVPILVHTVKTTFTRPLVAGVLFKGERFRAILFQKMSSPHKYPAPPHDLNLPNTGPLPQVSYNLPPSESEYWELESYYQNLTWDPCSINNKLVLSNDNRQVELVKRGQNYPPHPSRFTDYHQAVSKERLTGRCYFQMSVLVWDRSDKPVTFAVAYENIKQNCSSHECRFGMNDKSWAIECYWDHSVFLHNGNRVEIPAECSYTFGVFVDHEAGVLCFYHKKTPIKLLYSVKTTFTQPLVVGVHVEGAGSSLNFLNF